KRFSSAKVSVRIAGPGGAIHWPSGPRTRSGLSVGSWLITTTSSLVMARSVSSVLTPSARAVRKAAMVVSGARPRAPRWPCRSKAASAAALAAQIAQASDAACDIGMCGQQRRGLLGDGLHRIDDEEMLGGTTDSGKGRRLADSFWSAEIRPLGLRV